MSTTLDLVRLRAHGGIELLIHRDALEAIAANGWKLEGLTLADGGIAPPVAKRGRPRGDTGRLKQAECLALLIRHPSLKDDTRLLAKQFDVTDDTIRAWLAKFEDSHRRSLVGTAAEVGRNSVFESDEDRE